MEPDAVDPLAVLPDGVVTADPAASLAGVPPGDAVLLEPAPAPDMELAGASVPVTSTR